MLRLGVQDLFCEPIMKKQLDELEKSLFLDAVKDVKPLHCDKLPLNKKHPAPIPKQHYLEQEAIRHDMLSDYYDPADLETGDELLFARQGIQHSIIHKLRRGQYSINAELDLHGLFVRDAREAVVNFLRDCQYTHKRCVRIIHGKGYNSWQKQPILKVKLNNWLRQREEVMAFCSARQVDGGTGAVYVLLKGKKNGRK